MEFYENTDGGEFAQNKDDNENKDAKIKPADEKDGIEYISVFGQVEGHYALGAGQKSTKYEELIPLLVGCEQSKKIKGVLILLNTVGGDVEAGLALGELIASMSKPTVSLILGGGHSIGAVLAVSARKSFIVPSATMTIHPVRYNGLVLGVEQSFSYFRKMQERINNFIVAHSNIKKQQLEKLLFDTDELSADIGTIIDGSTAVQCGLIDESGGISQALTELARML